MYSCTSNGALRLTPLGSDVDAEPSRTAILPMRLCLLPPGITRLRNRRKEDETRLYLNGRDSTCPLKGYNARYLYYPTKLRTGLSVIQLISSVIGTPMNILGPVPHSLSRRPVKTRVPAISLPPRLGFSSPRSVNDCLFPGTLVIAALLMRPAVG